MKFTDVQEQNRTLLRDLAVEREWVENIPVDEVPSFKLGPTNAKSLSVLVESTGLLQSIVPYDSMLVDPKDITEVKALFPPQEYKQFQIDLRNSWWQVRTNQQSYPISTILQAKFPIRQYFEKLADRECIQVWNNWLLGYVLKHTGNKEYSLNLESILDRNFLEKAVENREVWIHDRVLHDSIRFPTYHEPKLPFWLYSAKAIKSGPSLFWLPEDKAYLVPKLGTFTLGYCQMHLQLNDSFLQVSAALAIKTDFTENIKPLVIDIKNSNMKGPIYE